MKINIKHPTDPEVYFTFTEDKIGEMTIEELLKNIEAEIIQTNPDLDRSKYWRISSDKTGNFLDNKSLCNSLNYDDSYSIYLM